MADRTNNTGGWPRARAAFCACWPSREAMCVVVRLEWRYEKRQGRTSRHDPYYRNDRQLFSVFLSEFREAAVATVPSVIPPEVAARSAIMSVNPEK